MKSSSLAVVVLVTACGAAQTSVETTSANVTGKADAIEAIVRAQCAHAQMCDELHGTHDFEGWDACTVAARGVALAGASCEHVIASPKLTRCLDAIHQSRCEAPRAIRLEPCRDADVCR